MLYRTREVAAALAGSAAAIVAAARFWLQFGTDRAALHVVQYVLLTYWLELVLLLLAAGSWLLFPLVRKRATRGIRPLVADELRAFRLHCKRREVLAATLVASPYLLVASAAIVLAVATHKPIGKLVKAKGALLLKYQSDDFKRFLFLQASTRVVDGDLRGAEAYYASVVEFFGKEKDADAGEHIETLKKHRTYATALKARADELERSFGPNRQSLYLLAEALSAGGRSDTIVRALERYDDLLGRLGNVHSEIERECARSSHGSHVTIAELLRQLALPELRGFASSAHARLAIDGLLGPGATDEKERAGRRLCNLIQRFGPALNLLEGDRASLRALLKKPAFALSGRS